MSERRPVVWSEGLLLSPQHFQQADRAMRHMVAQRFRMAHSFDWGLAHLSIDAEAIRNGRVVLTGASGVLPDGRRAVFHPDNFTFGQAVYLSRIVAAAQAVEGVEAVSVKKFERLGQPDTLPIGTGVLPMGRLEIAQLANNPNFRERGRMTVEAGGGK